MCIVGCGRIANWAHLPAARKLKEVLKLRAVVDSEPQMARKAAQEFGAEKYYFSTEEAFDDPQVQAVVLCLPNYLHCPVVIEAARKGKHVLVEKPLALNVAEAEQMIAQAEESRITLMVGQSRRFFSAVMESKRLYDEGVIGRLFHFITVWMQYLSRAETDLPPLIVPLVKLELWG